MTAPAGPYDDLIPRASAPVDTMPDDEAYWEEGSARPPTKNFAEFQANYLKDHNIDPRAVGADASAAAPASKAGPYDDLIPTTASVSHAAQQAGLGQRLAAFGRSLLPQPGESVPSAIGRDVTGFVAAPFRSALDAVAAPSVGEARRPNLRAPTPSLGLQTGTYDAEHGAVTDRQRALAGLATVANVGVGAIPVGEIASPLVRAGARVAVGSGVGAANSPDDPLLGAVVGGGLGAVHAGVTELPNLRNAAAETLAPGLAGRARLDAVREQATIAAQRQAAEYHAARDIYGNIKPEGPAQGPAPTLPFAQAQADAALPAADATLDHADVLRTIKAGWDASNPYGDLVPEEGVAKPASTPQIASHDNTVSGIAPARDPGPLAADAGSGDAPIPRSGVAASSSADAPMAATATHEPTPTAPDLVAQPALADQHRQAVQLAGGPSGLPPVGAGGAGAESQVEYRNAGLPGIQAGQNGLDMIKDALDRPYAGLEHAPNDIVVRDALLHAGSARGTATAVAKQWRQYVENGLSPDQLNAARAQITADNFGMAAQGQAEKGAAYREERDLRRTAAFAPPDPSAPGGPVVQEVRAANLRQHEQTVRQLVPGGTDQSAHYQTYKDRYLDKVAPELERVFRAGGGTDEMLRGVKPNSVFAPFAVEDIAKGTPSETVQPNRLRTLGNRYSSATKVATGSGVNYMVDPMDAVEKVYGERAHVAAMNEVGQAIRTRGRDLGGKDSDVMKGEKKVAFNDLWQHVNTEDPSASRFVAIPNHIAEALDQFMARSADTGPKGRFAKGVAALNKGLIRWAMKINPGVTVFHGGNILANVNKTAGAGPLEAARIVASTLPSGNLAAGGAQVASIDMTSAETTQDIMDLAKYGGIRPAEIDEVHDAPTTLAGRIGAKVRAGLNVQHELLFGQNGADIKGRVASYRNFRAANPDASLADAAQFVAQRFGQYNKTNAPGLVYMGQKYGYTSFAPAGAAFTSTAVKGLVGQGGGFGAANMAKTLAKGVIGAEIGKQALNYATVHHSTLGNAPGHREDADLGSADPERGERYIKGSYWDPLENRALNTLGIRPLVEGQGATGMFASASNEAMSQLGISVHMAAGVLGNSALRVDQQFDPQPLVKNQVGESNRFMKIVQRGIGTASGGIGALSGASSFSADKSLKDRALDAVHMNPIAYGGTPRTNMDVKAQGYQDKINEGMSEIGRADDKQAKIRELMDRAQSDGYTPIQMMLMQKQWLRAAVMSDAVKGQLHQKAIAKRGFSPSATP